MIRRIAIYGAGGFGRETAYMIKKISHKDGVWDIIGFFDDGIEKGTDICNIGKVLGGLQDVNDWASPLNVVICIGSPIVSQKIIMSLTNPHLSFPNIISPDFVIEDDSLFSIGKGNIIKSSCRVTTNVRIGDFNIFNGGITVGHDTSIGNFNTFMPGVRISGEVSIGDRNLFGSMSFVKQCLKVGNDVTLSPLSPLLSKPKDGKTYIGNPAKIFKF